MWNLKQFANRPALVDEAGETVTYQRLSEIGEEIHSVAGSRKLIVSLCKNSIGSVAGYVSFINQKLVPIMLNAGMERKMLEELLSIYMPSYLWMPTDMMGSFEGALEENIVYSVYDYSLVKTDYEKTYAMYHGLALLLTTSGSTGSPKFVRQSYDNIRANAKSIAAYLELDETERAITTLPMNYTYGLSVINSHFLVGAAILVTEHSLMQKEFWEFFKEQKATSIAGVPYTYEILEKLRFRRMELPSLRTMTQAGGKLMPELHARFAEYAREKGKKFVVMYGQCEATARMGYLPADKAMEKCGSMGIAIPGGSFRLIRPDGEEITEPHTAGELVYEGANVTLGYAECGADLIKEDERKGVLQTGDMAEMDEDGYFYIVGRKKRFLKIYGNRVNLDEIDRMIKGNFEGLDCASAGVDDHMYIFVDDADKADAVKQFVAGRTKLNPAAFHVTVIDEIPKNDAGKVLYPSLEKYYKA